MDYLFLGIMGISILIVVGLGVAVKYFRAYWLIAGYNTMAKEQQALVDIRGLANFVGNMTLITGGLLAVATGFILLEQEVLGTITFAALLPLSIYVVVKSQKFTAKARAIGSRGTGRSKYFVWGFIAFMVVTFALIGVLLYYSVQPLSFDFKEDYLDISGVYGEKIHFAEVEEVEMQRELPKILARTNGSSVGTIKKGYFKLAGIDKAKLLLDTSKPPFIFLTSKGDLIIFNGQDEAETEAIYQRLLANKQ